MNAHAKILKAHPSFSSLSSRNLGRLTENSSIEEMPKGSVVVHEGSPGEALYLVLTGRCQSVLLLPDGAYQVLDIYGPGDTFGERALMSQGEHWATVQVITDTVLLRLDGKDVHKLMDREPRLAKQLANRLREHMRSLREQVDTLRAELGRVVAVTCLSDRIHGPMIAENLSLGLRTETDATVLFVRVLAGEETPRLADWEPPSPSRNGGFRYQEELMPGKGGLQHLGLFAEGGESECRRVASLIGHLARYFRYVVISTAPELDRSVMEEFQRQSDFSYVLFGQSPEELYRTNLFLREIRGLLDANPTQIRPVVCLRVPDRCRPFEELKERLGAPVHAVIRGLPESTQASDTHSHYLLKPDDRFSANIRYLAREIGRCRVGLALSSGGAKGFAHIGVMQVLEENGIHVDVIAGASMGAYLGSLKAFGLTGPELRELAMDMAGRFGLLRIMDPVVPPRRGFMRGRKSRRLLEQTIGDAHFSDLMLQMRIIATDLETLERVVYDTGQVSTAVQASMAMPGVVVPVTREGRVLVDGGTAEPLPVNTLIEMGVERIIASNTIPNPDEMKRQAMSDREAAALPAEHHHLFPSLKHYLNYFEEGNILDIVMRSMHALQTRVVEGACKQADVVLRPFLYDGKWHDFGRPERYLDHGRRVAEEQLPELLALTKPSGITLENE